ncbi:MAG TPA: DUF2071 domain-containing protein [Chryseolinea sp.]
MPTIVGTIDRRILINYQADKEVIERFLPSPFRPKLVNGKAIVGICLIRLKNIRPKGIPFNVGVSSENGAHRIAVEWMENDEKKEGVYVPRRDTSSRFNFLAGGRVFPGVHHLANFNVVEDNGHYSIAFKSDDETFLEISAKETSEWSSQSVFDNQACASDFFKQGSIGYSPDKIGHAFEGLELMTKNWEVSPLNVIKVRSSFFEDESIFPKGTIKFDNALLMRNIDHEWNSKKTIRQ